MLTRMIGPKRTRNTHQKLPQGTKEYPTQSVEEHLGRSLFRAPFHLLFAFFEQGHGSRGFQCHGCLGGWVEAERFGDLPQGFLCHFVYWIPSLVTPGSFSCVTEVSRGTNGFGDLPFLVAIGKKSGWKERHRRQTENMRRQSLQPGRLEEMAYICEILRIHSRIAIHLDVRFRTSLGFLSLKLIDVHFVRSQMLGQCNRYSTRHAWRIANAKLKLVNDKRAKGYRSISSHGGDDVGALKENSRGKRGARSCLVWELWGKRGCAIHPRTIARVGFRIVIKNPHLPRSQLELLTTWGENGRSTQEEEYQTDRIFFSTYRLLLLRIWSLYLDASLCACSVKLQYSYWTCLVLIVIR